MLLSNSKNIPAALALLLCLALSPALYGCGYGLGADMPTVMGDGKATLKLVSVEQPTLYPWVVYTLRSSMRDEVNARNLAEWAEGGNADFNMHIKVNSFTMRSAVSSSTDATLLYNGSVSITAIIYNGADNSEAWRTSVTYSDEFDNVTEEEAARSLFTQAVRRIADNMRNTF